MLKKYKVFLASSGELAQDLILPNLRDLYDMLGLRDLANLLDRRDMWDLLDLRELRDLLDLWYLQDRQDLRDRPIIPYYKEILAEYNKKYKALLTKHRQEIFVWTDRAMEKLHSLTDVEIKKYFPNTCKEELKAFRDKKGISPHDAASSPGNTWK